MCRRGKTEITHLRARQILDNRGNPPVEEECTLACGLAARSGAPSGASTGSREALELRDAGADRFGGKGEDQKLLYWTGFAG